MRTFLLLFLFANSAFAQLNISNPFYTAGLLKPAAAGGGGGIVVTGLDSGSDSVNNPATTASVSPASGCVVYLVLGYAVSGGGNAVAADTATITGGMATWAKFIGRTSGGGRRAILVYRGTGTPSSGTISITMNTGSGTWTETFWSVIQVTGQDTTPDDAGVGADDWAVGATSGASGDVGTPGTGDVVMTAVIHETSEAVTLEGGYTGIHSLTGGTDLRTLHTGYILGSSDETPSATWATSSGWEMVGWNVNKAP